MTQEERKAKYLQLCTSGKITSLFNQPWWLDATGSWDVAFGFRNDQIVGAMPYVPQKRWGISFLGMPDMTHHLRIWMDKPPDISEHKWLTREKQIIWSMVDSLPPYGYFSMVFDEKSFDNWLPFHWKNFRQEMRYTFVIDHADSETIDQHLNRNLKRNLRESSASVQIIPDVFPSRFWEIWLETHERQKVNIPWHLNEIFFGMDHAIQAHGAGMRIGAADLNGNLLAVAYLVWDEDTAYYFLAGDTDAGRQAGASILLCREALRIAFDERNLKTFDFCGSMLENITEMRRQFGARAVPLMKIFKARWKWLEIVYGLTR